MSQVVDELNARNALRRPFSVRCIVNQDLSFIEEVATSICTPAVLGGSGSSEVEL